MIAKLSVIVSMVPLFSALLVKASPVAQSNGGMMKRYDENQARFMQDAGCFKDDNNDRIFKARPKRNIPWEQTTLEACYGACLEEHFFVAGLQNGNECWCSKEAPKKELLTDMAECNLPCSGENKIDCGGVNRMHVWTFLKKDKIESFAPGGEYTPVYTYSRPESTWLSAYQGTGVEQTMSATTIEVVAAVTDMPPSTSVPSATASATAAATQSLT